MSTYVIGDVQGCFEKLLALLKVINFNENKDYLWFTGDLINRGPQSLETLRFVKDLGVRALTVLGNHDMALLAVGYKALPYDFKKFNFMEILEAPDAPQLLAWLQARPLAHYDPFFNTLLVHAGIHPSWDLPLALSLAAEVETMLTGPENFAFYQNLWGDGPVHWDPSLTGWERLRYIVNCLTRMRFCEADGALNLQVKDHTLPAPQGLIPWFEMPNRLLQEVTILFGHWASLKGQCSAPNMYALDTACIWGGTLTALRLEDKQLFAVPCSLCD